MLHLPVIDVRISNRNFARSYRAISRHEYAEFSPAPAEVNIMAVIPLNNHWEEMRSIDLADAIRGGVWVAENRAGHQDNDAYRLGNIALQRGLRAEDLMGMRPQWWPTPPHPQINWAGQLVTAGTWDLDALNRKQAESKKPILAIGPRKLLLP